MDMFRVYVFSTSAWLVIQSLVLCLAPKLVILMLSIETRQATDIEAYLCRALGLSQTAFAMLLIALLSSMPSKAERAAGAMAPASAMLIITGTLHVATAIFTYVRFTSTSQWGFAAGSAISAALAAFGQWLVLFGQDDVQLSKRTGKDKHVSKWPLGDRKGKHSLTSDASK